MKKRENKSTCEYERNSCHKSYQKMVVQISFLIFSRGRAILRRLTEQLSFICYATTPQVWHLFKAE